jgi:large subunit ribosomal protein L18
MDKKIVRTRRSKKTRSTIRRLEAVRLVVHRTSQHIYAQIISSAGDAVITAASTLEKEVKTTLANGSNIDAAKKIGQLIAERALKKDIKKVAFDRSGFKYHGRVKALAEAAREAGLDF